MKNNIIVFVVEGDSTEYDLVSKMSSCFFVGKYQSVVIQLPVGQNCYMLWKILKADNFDTDIIEVIRQTIVGADKKLDGISRQQIDQVFMFFDLELQQNNLSDGEDLNEVLREMLEVFNNETENGKLYISYPMIEATRDFIENNCDPYTACSLDKETIKQYKNKSGEGNINGIYTHYTVNTWNNMLNVFYMRISCLFGEESLTFEEYRKIEPMNIYNQEQKYFLDRDRCFVLSALPEFLFDYFKKDFWNSHAKQHNKLNRGCSKKQ